MSRIGNQPVTIPQGVTATIAAGRIVVKSATAELSQAIPAGIKVEIKDNQVICSPISKTTDVSALHGLIRSIIANMVLGVTVGFTKTLEIQGTGYRVKPLAEGIELSLGFSHPIIYHQPAGIKLEIKENKFIVVSGPDKYLVGQVAANIKKFRHPDVYKGKGIRYQGEVIKLKPGKAAKAAVTT
ncbi:MAG: 50S ribosomal protein L6 [Candidatus Beckwithbacteria bacterium]|nr:50S ribosomal protein L6 [Candidatus Beckwithbacteria bacterium]